MKIIGKYQSEQKRERKRVINRNSEALASSATSHQHLLLCCSNVVQRDREGGKPKEAECLHQSSVGALTSMVCASGFDHWRGIEASENTGMECF